MPAVNYLIIFLTIFTILSCASNQSRDEEVMEMDEARTFR